MTQYEKLNLKFNRKNATEVELKLLLNMIGDSKDDTNFPYKWLLIDKVQSSIKVLLIIQHLIWNYQILNCLKWYNQKDFLEEVLDN